MVATCRQLSGGCAMHQKDALDESLIGLPRIGRILHVSHPTARLYAAERRFATVVIEGRYYAKLGDVLAFKALRDRQRQSETKPAA